MFQHAVQDFAGLVSSLPELVEPYESVDSNGASIRRYMINDPASHLEVALDPSPPPRVPPRAERGAGVAVARGGEWGEGGSGGKPVGVLERDLAYLQRRYRSAFILASSSEAAGGSNSAGELLRLLLNNRKTWPSCVPLYTAAFWVITHSG